MKKLFSFTILTLLLCMNSFAQVTVPEPEFAEETILLTSDDAGTKLTRENAIVKTKAGASLYLTGIGKIKTRITLKGISSVSPVKGKPTTQLIIKAQDNNTDPNSFISIFKFEVKGKERRAQIGEAGTLSAAKTNSLASIDYKAKKYGESSYLILLEGLEAGEYGISLGDPNSLTEKNTLKITTFSVSR